MSSPCFNEIVRQCGLSEVFAADTIARACDRVGLKPEQLTPAQIPQVLPQIERALRIFLPKDQVAGRLASIQQLMGSTALR